VIETPKSNPAMMSTTLVFNRIEPPKVCDYNTKSATL